MYTDGTYRAFLLKMADAETETAIEEAILNGSVDTAYLRQIEEELIDDSLFGRLSEEEKRHFNSDFLCTVERKGKFRFASALQQYSAQHFLHSPRFRAWNGLRRFATIPWALPLVGALGCALLAAAWLGARNSGLRHELARSTQENDKRQRIITSFQEEQKRLEQSMPTSAASGPRQTSEQGAVPMGLSVIRLSSGVSRGLVAVPVLHLGKQTSMASIVLELPFDPRGNMHEELFDSNDKSIWSQQFAASDLISRNGIAIIMLPTALFSTGDYRLHVEAGATGEELGGKVTYLFRVRRE
jgi:hypothetical protein